MAAPWWRYYLNSYYQNAHEKPAAIYSEGEDISDTDYSDQKWKEIAAKSSYSGPIYAKVSRYQQKIEYNIEYRACGSR